MFFKYFNPNRSIAVVVLQHYRNWVIFLLKLIIGLTFTITGCIGRAMMTRVGSDIVRAVMYDGSFYFTNFGSLIFVSVCSLFGVFSRWFLTIQTFTLLTKIPFLGPWFFDPLNKAFWSSIVKTSPYYTDPDGIGNIVPPIRQEVVVEQVLNIDADIVERVRDHLRAHPPGAAPAGAIEAAPQEAIPAGWNEQFRQVVAYDPRVLPGAPQAPVALPHTVRLDEALTALGACIREQGRNITVTRRILEHNLINVSQIPAGDLASQLGFGRSLAVLVCSLINKAYPILAPGHGRLFCGTESTQLRSLVDPTLVSKSLFFDSSVFDSFSSSSRGMRSVDDLFTAVEGSMRLPGMSVSVGVQTDMDCEIASKLAIVEDLLNEYSNASPDFAMVAIDSLRFLL